MQTLRPSSLPRPPESEFLRWDPVLTALQVMFIDSKVWEAALLWSIDPCWRRQWPPSPVLLPGKSHGRRSLVGCSPWGRSESDTTERLHFHFSLLCTGEGNGNPLQCSCLENSRDRGAWWATIYGVTQSRTPLKWLSSSSSSIDPCDVRGYNPSCCPFNSPQFKNQWLYNLIIETFENLEKYKRWKNCLCESLVKVLQINRIHRKHM